MEPQAKSWFNSLGYAAIAIVFLVLGLIGLVIPVIPGLIFLVLALLMISRMVPPLERWLRRHPVMDEAHIKFAKYQNLKLRDQCKVVVWSSAKAICDVLSFVSKLINRITPW